MDKVPEQETREAANVPSTQVSWDSAPVKIAHAYHPQYRSPPQQHQHQQQQQYRQQQQQHMQNLPGSTGSPAASCGDGRVALLSPQNDFATQGQMNLRMPVKLLLGRVGPVAETAGLQQGQLLNKEPRTPISIERSELPDVQDGPIKATSPQPQTPHDQAAAAYQKPLQSSQPPPQAKQQRKDRQKQKHKQSEKQQQQQNREQTLRQPKQPEDHKTAGAPGAASVAKATQIQHEVGTPNAAAPAASARQQQQHQQQQAQGPAPAPYPVSLPYPGFWPGLPNASASMGPPPPLPLTAMLTPMAMDLALLQSKSCQAAHCATGAAAAEAFAAGFRSALTAHASLAGPVPTTLGGIDAVKQLQQQMLLLQQVRQLPAYLQQQKLQSEQAQQLQSQQQRLPHERGAGVEGASSGIDNARPPPCSPSQPQTQPQPPKVPQQSAKNLQLSQLFQLSQQCQEPNTRTSPQSAAAAASTPATSSPAAKMPPNTKVTKSTKASTTRSTATPMAPATTSEQTKASTNINANPSAAAHLATTRGACQQTLAVPSPASATPATGVRSEKKGNKEKVSKKSKNSPGIAGATPTNIGGAATPLPVGAVLRSAPEQDIAASNQFWLGAASKKLIEGACSTADHTRVMSALESVQDDTEALSGMVNKFSGSILKLALNKQGCRVLQHLLELAPVSIQLDLVSELRGHMMECVMHMHGNFVVQQCIKVFPQEHLQFIISEIEQHCERLSSHMYGCRTIQRLIEFASPAQFSNFLARILRVARALAYDTYGNNVLRQMLEQCGPEVCRTVTVVLLSQPPAGRSTASGGTGANVGRNVVVIGRHRTASLVLERCLEVAANAPDSLLEPERQAIVQAMLQQPSGGGSSALQELALDQFGNYLVQRTIQCSRGAECDTVSKQLKGMEQQLRRSRGGKHILTTLRRELPGVHPSTAAPPNNSSNINNNKNNNNDGSSSHHAQSEAP